MKLISKIIKELNDIRNIYNIINNQLLKEDPLETNENTIWSNVDKYIMIDIQKKIQNKKEINIDEEKKYIELLNKYQKYFNFKEYNLIPNSYGVLHNISNLKDFNDIPDEILLGIKRILFKDLKANSTYKGIIIDGIEKVSMVEIGNIIEECFKNKKKEEEEKFNYNTTYGLLKVIIRYVPIDEERKKKQVRFYNLYKLFDKDIGDMIEVNSHENLYSHINKGLIQYINEQINNCVTISKTKKFIDNIFDFINENKDILDPNNYDILPNQLGYLKKINELKKDNNIFEELKDVISEDLDIRYILMDKRIISFSPEKILSNQDIKEKMNELI